MNRLENWRRNDAPPIWLDYHEYAARLLANGNAPWLDTAALISWFRQSQGLLGSGVISLPVMPAVRSWAGAHPELVSAMGEKQRLLFAVKTLLGDDTLGGHLAETMSSLRASFSSIPIAIVLPAPEQLIRIARELAAGSDDAGDIDEDDVDSAAVYVADFLRRFSECDIDAVLLQEPAEQDVSADTVSLYRPIANVVGHYQWELGLHLGRKPAWNAEDSGLHYLIAPEAIDGIATGIELDAAFWENDGGKPDLPDGAFHYGRIPADAVPELVLERLAALR